MIVIELRVRSQKGKREKRKRMTRATERRTKRVIGSEPVVNNSTRNIMHRDNPTLCKVSWLKVMYCSKLK